MFLTAIVLSAGICTLYRSLEHEAALCYSPQCGYTESQAFILKTPVLCYFEMQRFGIFDPELGSRSIISLSVDGDGDWDGDDRT